MLIIRYFLSYLSETMFSLKSDIMFFFHLNKPRIKNKIQNIYTVCYIMLKINKTKYFLQIHFFSSINLML